MLALVSTPGGSVPAEVRQVDEPRPGPSEAVLKVEAFGINRGELSLLPNRPNWQPGQDVAGVVEQPAADGSGPPRGARAVGLVDQGGWAERVAVPVSRLAVRPEAASAEAAAALPVAGLTALRALRVGGPLLGRRVLVTGASGGVGHFAVQLARAGGATVAGVASAAHAEAVRALGAVQTVTAVDQAAGLYDVILESVGGTSLSAAVHKVAPGGSVVIFGNSSREQAALSFPDFAGHAGARIYAFFVYLSGEPPTFGEDLGYLAALVGDGRLVPRLGYRGSWRDLPAALGALQNRQVVGKVVLRVD
ncbi:MAG: zinc-binding dehydrogenase [Chloroflexi bacterium]|nr:zinc-binding dehydrogenase [Chloroflexota bacterium]